MPKDIIQIIKNEYILLIIIFLLFSIFLYFKLKLKKFDIIPFLGNINKVPLIQSILFFLLFQIIDYIYEDGFISMIKLWFMYWLFGVLAYLLSNNINYYKNMQFYNLKFI